MVESQQKTNFGNESREYKKKHIIQFSKLTNETEPVCGLKQC